MIRLIWTLLIILLGLVWVFGRFGQHRRHGRKRH